MCLDFEQLPCIYQFGKRAGFDAWPAHGQTTMDTFLFTAVLFLGLGCLELST